MPYIISQCRGFLASLLNKQNGVKNELGGKCTPWSVLGSASAGQGHGERIWAPHGDRTGQARTGQILTLLHGPAGMSR